MIRRIAGLLAALTLLAGCGGTAPSAPKTSAPKPAPSSSSTSSPSTSSSSTSSAPAASQAPSPAKKLTPVSFEMAWIPIANQLPFYLAKARGYYSSRGLDVTLVSGKGSALTAQQVAAGKYDLGQTDLSFMALADGKGAHLEAFMVEFPKTPFGVFASKQKGITTWKDLYGHSVAVSAGSPEVFLLPATFKKLGLDYAKVKIVNTNPANKTPDYLTGKVSAVGTDLAGYEPIVAKKRPSNELWFGDVLPVPYLGMFGQVSYIKAHPQVVRAFAAGTAEAISALGGNPATVAEAANDMVKANPGQGLNAGLFEASWKLYQGFLTTPANKGRPVGWMSQQSWQQTLQILHLYAGLKGSMTPSDYYTNSYLAGG